MGQITINEHWGNNLFPNGIHFPSSTIISGRGGSGKPLVQLSFVAEWLRKGGKAIGIPLQYPDSTFLKSSLWQLNNIDVNQFQDQIKFVQFDPEIENIQEPDNESLKVNLLKSEIWDEMLNTIPEKLNTNANENILIFVSALNLLLFAPKYRQEIVEKIKNLINNNHNFTFLFTVSNNIMGEDIAVWENAADNLLFTEMAKDKRLLVYAERINNKNIQSDKYGTNIQPQTLDEIKSVAEKNRKSLIPKLKKLKDE